jgi:hypothetical protein
MLGFSHMLDSSASSSASSLCEPPDADFDPEQQASRPHDKDNTEVFLKHLRKCFITTDEDSYCEHGILPDLKVFDGRSRKFKSKNNDIEVTRTILSKRIDAQSYDYVKIYSKSFITLIDFNEIIFYQECCFFSRI